MTCDWRAEPGRQRKFALEIEPPSLDDNTSDLDRLRRGLARRTTSRSPRRAAVLRSSAATCARPTGTSAVALEIATGSRPTAVSPDRPPARRRSRRRYGVAVDMGTTTVVVYLVDFASGRVVDTASAYNAQIACGDDVISRIIYSQARRWSGSSAGARRRDHQRAPRGAAAAQRRRCRRASTRSSIAGNTTMTHLLLGIDPEVHPRGAVHPDDAAAPSCSPASLASSSTRAPACTSCRRWQLRRRRHHRGRHLVRACSPTGQADAVHGHRHQRRDRARQQDWLISCACSAGPPSRAAACATACALPTGAIEDVFDRRRHPRAAPSAPSTTRRPWASAARASSTCSASCFVTGVVDKSGRIDRDAPTDRVRVATTACRVRRRWARRRAARGDGHRRSPRSTSTTCIRAKAAIYAGFAVLCASVGVDLADVEQVFIGGAFGQYLNVEKAIRSACCPTCRVERFPSSATRRRWAPSPRCSASDIRHGSRTWPRKMTYLELSADNTFMDEYTSALFLPHTDLTRSQRRDAARAARAARPRRPPGNGGDP